MKRFLVLITFVVISHMAFGQNLSAIDSLKNLLPSDNIDLRIEVYNELAWEYRKSYPDSTIYYSKKAIEQVGLIGEKVKLAKPLNFLGVGYYYKGENVKAFDFYNKARDTALIYGDSIQYGHALNSIGRIYFNQGNYVQAYDYFFRSLGVFQSLEDNQGISYGYKSLAELYQSQNNYQKALEMSLKTAELREQTDNYSGLISIYLEIADIHKSSGDYTSALDYFDKAYSIAESINDEVNLAIIKLGISDLNTIRNQYSSALMNAQEALNHVEGSNNASLLNKIYFQIGLIHYEEGRFDQAEEYLNNVERISSRTNDVFLEKEAFYYLSKIYEKRGDLQKAFNYFKNFSDLRETVDNVQAAREIERLESRIEIENREKENALLKAKQEADQKIIKQQRLQNIALWVIVAITIFWIITLWLSGRRRRKDNIALRGKNKKIEEQRWEISNQNSEIRRQNRKLEKRNKALDELNNEKDSLLSIVAHDLKSPFHRVKGLTELLRLSKLNSEQSQYVDMIRQNAKHGLYLITDLLDVNAIEIGKEAPVITRVNLKSFLEEEVHRFIVEATNKQIELMIDCEENVLVDTDKTYLARMVDNLLSNAIKFSPLGTEIKLKGVLTDSGFQLIIKDQGQGFSEIDKAQLFKKFKRLSAQPTGGETSNGLGLAIVKTLVDRLGGKINLVSDLGKGSEFILSFPHIQVAEPNTTDANA